jgi:formylmethanofuran dehydrogenase subunit E
VTPRPKPPPPPEPEEEPVDEEEEARKARFRIKYMHRVKCAGCGRMIPEGGSKQVDEEPYCPDCFYALPEEVRQAAEEAEAAAMAGEEGEAAEISRELEAPVEPHELEAVPGCESCGKAVPEDKLQAVEGFAICQACLSADAELAVHLARARHQKRLQKLREELGE